MLEEEKDDKEPNTSLHNLAIATQIGKEKQVPHKK
jgi:hypothetical protein